MSIASRATASPSVVSTIETNTSAASTIKPCACNARANATASHGAISGSRAAAMRASRRCARRCVPAGCIDASASSRRAVVAGSDFKQARVHTQRERSRHVLQAFIGLRWSRVGTVERVGRRAADRITLTFSRERGDAKCAFERCRDLRRTFITLHARACFGGGSEKCKRGIRRGRSGKCNAVSACVAPTFDARDIVANGIGRRACLAEQARAQNRVARRSCARQREHGGNVLRNRQFRSRCVIQPTRGVVAHRVGCSVGPVSEPRPANAGSSARRAHSSASAAHSAAIPARKRVRNTIASVATSAVGAHAGASNSDASRARATSTTARTRAISCGVGRPIASIASLASAVIIRSSKSSAHSSTSSRAHAGSSAVICAANAARI